MGNCLESMRQNKKKVCAVIIVILIIAIAVISLITGVFIRNQVNIMVR